MRFSVVVVAVCLLLHAGCKAKINPGATYQVVVLAKGNDGKATPQGSALQVEGARVESRQEITHEDQTFSLLIRKTQYGKATFDVTFPDKTTQMIQVKAGEAKDVLPAGQKFGIRIELQDSH